MVVDPLAVGGGARNDDVVAVEVTIDGILVIADQMNLTEFPTVLAIRPNIPNDELRDIVAAQVRRDLTAQEILDHAGNPEPTVAAMVDTLSRPDRAIECRWWRVDAGGVMVRFVVCRKGGRHVIAVRDGDLLVLQLVARQVGLAGMVTTVLGPAKPANVEPLTGVAAELAECRTVADVAEQGVAAASARIYAEIIKEPTSWVEMIAVQRHRGGTLTQSEAAAGVVDSPLGRVVSLPRKVNGELFGSFLSGTNENLQRALDGLLEFIPAGSWDDPIDSGDTMGASDAINAVGGITSEVDDFR